MKEEIINLRNQALADIMETVSKEDLAQIEILYLGRKGKLSSFMKQLGKLGEDERKEVGVLLNESKQTIVSAIQRQTRGVQKHEFVDPTVPGVKPPIGHKHLISQAIEDIAKIFERMGFARMRYPEVEWDYYAFEALNISKEHPARDEWETFFVDLPENLERGKIVLTPHTSSGQVREMERMKPPIGMINISKTYRRQSDVSHVPMFHQFEGLYIDKNVSISNLKGTIDYFMKNYYGEGRKARLRPYDFRFTEPSFEIDISCDVCSGKGCKLCKEGWLELGGAGMVHPVVLKNGGIDPKEYSGFAFGWGVERALMMRRGLSIPDVRSLYSTDIAYLSQY